LFGDLLALGDARRRRRAGEILPDRAHELGLLLAECDDLRIRRDAGESLVEGRGRDPAGARLGPQRSDEALEIRLRRLLLRRLQVRVSRLRRGKLRREA
jgi:hypothetical protein